MRWNREFIIIGVILLAVLGFLALFINREATGENSAAGRSHVASAPSADSSDLDATPSQDHDSYPELRGVSEPVFSTVEGEGLQAVFQDLAKCYQFGVLPVRIRLQDQLNQQWELNPPAATVLLGAVADRSFPLKMRSYLARIFANQVKKQTYAEEEVKVGNTLLRDLILKEDEDAMLRAELANTLTMIDSSDEAVRAVTPLLSDTNTQVVVSAVNALTKTTNLLAIEAAYQFVRNDTNLVEANPIALLAALGPLSTTDKDVSPILDRLIQQTDDFKIYVGAIQCLIHAKSALPVLEVIAAAYDSAERFPEHSAQARRLCALAAQKHVEYFRNNSSASGRSSPWSIEQLLNSEDQK